MLASLACLPLLFAADGSSGRDLHGPLPSPYERFERSLRKDAPQWFVPRTQPARSADWAEPSAIDISWTMATQPAPESSPWSLSDPLYEMEASARPFAPVIEGVTPVFDEVMQLYGTPPYQSQFVVRYSTSPCN